MEYQKSYRKLCEGVYSPVKVEPETQESLLECFAYGVPCLVIGYFLAVVLLSL